MLARAIRRRTLVFGTILAASLPLGTHFAAARTFARHYGGVRHAAYFSRHFGRGRSHFGSRGVIQCVPFAREASGIELKGNAGTWWNKAAGLYARGAAPEPGAVLNFRANRAMRLGHVAVVREVANSRQIEIDQAHWAGRGISRDTSVIDVSPDNDWSAVRVAMGHDGKYGSIYPTYGFIYDRPSGAGMQTASVLPVAAPLPALNPPPRDLRPHAGRRARPAGSPQPTYEEVAEMPASGGLDLSLGGLTLDAPDRSLR